MVLMNFSLVMGWGFTLCLKIAGSNSPGRLCASYNVFSCERAAQ